MVARTELYRLKKCAIALRQAEYSHSTVNVEEQIKKNYSIVINIIFSDVKGAVPLQSPKCSIEIMQKTKPIIGMAQRTLSKSDKMHINVCQSYLDDLDRINMLNDDLATKSNLFIKEYRYIFFDLQRKTKNYVHYFSSNIKSVSPLKYHPMKTFNKKCNSNHNNILLHINISVVRLIQGDSNSRMSETFSYIPKKDLKLWTTLNV